MKKQALVNMLPLAPQKPKTRTQKLLSAVTTPFREGILSRFLGRIPTDSTAYVVGSLVRDAAKSYDGWWTLDLCVHEIRLDEEPVTSNEALFIRINVEPGRMSHEFCEKNFLKRGHIIEAFGPLKFERKDLFLELHTYSYLKYATQ